MSNRASFVESTTSSKKVQRKKTCTDLWMTKCSQTHRLAIVTEYLKTGYQALGVSNQLPWFKTYWTCIGHNTPRALQDHGRAIVHDWDFLPQALLKNPQKAWICHCGGWSYSIGNLFRNQCYVMARTFLLIPTTVAKLLIPSDHQPETWLHAYMLLMSHFFMAHNFLSLFSLLIVMH